jgi:hypothetical protein
MTSTPMYAGDVSEMYADPDLHPEWSTVSEPMVISWPEREDLWEQYLDLRRRDELGGVSNFENATAFYRENREEMDRGADLLDPDDGDPKTEISGLQHVYNLLFKHGREAFDAEFQLAPRKSDTAFELSAKQVAANISGTGRFVLPKGFHAATAFVDCMDADGLRWVVMGIGPQRMCCVLGYGRYPESGTLYPEKALVPEQNKIFAGMLSGLVDMLCSQQITRADGGRPITLSGVAVDRGWKPRIVEWVLRKSKYASICFASLGYGWSKFAPTRQDGKSKAGVIGIGDHCYLSDNGHFRYVGHHADYWREYAQRSFLALPLTAGATAIYGGDDLEHYDFAREICSEVLADKGAGTNGTEFWRYVKGPGAKNHYLDCVVGCMVLASWLRLYDATQTLAGNIGQARAAGNHRRKLKLIRR